MKIKSVENIPIILRRKYNSRIIIDFCNIINDNELFDIDKYTKYISIPENNRDTVSEFMDFFLDLTRIEPYTYKVKYEDLYDIAKDSFNELFIIRLDNNETINVLIKDYDNETGILRFELL